MKIKTVNVPCPTCEARPGRDCNSLRMPSCNSLGGGWGGAGTLDRPHPARVQARRQAEADWPEDYRAALDETRRAYTAAQADFDHYRDDRTLWALNRARRAHHGQIAKGNS